MRSTGRAPVLAALTGLVVLGGCTGAGAETRAIVKTADAGSRPAVVGLLYPHVEAGASKGKGRWPGGRKLMASEVDAIVYVQVRGQLEEHSEPEFRDLSADGPLKSRAALLGASIHREYSLNGAIPVSRANELGRAVSVPACLLVSVIKFGPSDTKLELRSLAGLVKPAAGAPPAPGWINCGVVAVAFKTPGGQVLWEAGHLASLPVDTGTQEQAVQRCIEALFATWPWRK